MFGTFTAPQLEGDTMNTHPALVAHRKGASRVLSTGRDFTAYVVTLTTGEFILTVWTDENLDIGIQEV